MRPVVKCINETGRPTIRTDLLVNWGCANIKRDVVCQRLLNLPERVNVAGNKLLSFRALDGVPVPAWNESKQVAATWIEAGSRVVCRRVLRGSGGVGIVLASTVADLVDAPLYVKYCKKKKEFRAHIFNGEVIDVQEKRRRAGFGDRIPYIFNHSNGYVFCRDNVTFPETARNLAVSAVTKLGLDFGAVDIIWNERNNEYTVLEVNTAPGLEGQTLVNYGNAIKRIVDEARAL